MKGIKTFLVVSASGVVDYLATQEAIADYFAKSELELLADAKVLEEKFLPSEVIAKAFDEVFAEAASRKDDTVSKLTKWVGQKLCNPANAEAVEIQIAGYLSANTGEGKKFLSARGRDGGHRLNPAYKSEETSLVSDDEDGLVPDSSL